MVPLWFHGTTKTPDVSLGQFQFKYNQNWQAIWERHENKVTIIDEQIKLKQLTNLITVVLRLIGFTPNFVVPWNHGDKESSNDGSTMVPWYHEVQGKPY